MSASDALVAMADNNPAVHNAEVGQVKFTKVCYSCLILPTPKV